MTSMYEIGFDFDGYIRELVETGRYDDERDVIRTALRLLHDEEIVRASRLAELEALVEPALAELDQGLGLSVDEAKIKIDEVLEARRGRPAAAE